MHTLSDKAAAKTLVTWMIIGSVVLVVLGFVCGCAMPPREQKRLDPDKWVLRTGHVLTRSFIEDDDGQRYEVFTTQHGLSVLPAPRAGAQGTAKKTDISNEM